MADVKGSYDEIAEALLDRHIENAHLKNRIKDLERRQAQHHEEVDGLLEKIKRLRAEAIESELGQEVKRLREENAKVRKLAYDQHGELYRSRFRAQMKAAQEMLDENERLKALVSE